MVAFYSSRVHIVIVHQHRFGSAGNTKSLMCVTFIAAWWSALCDSTQYRLRKAGVTCKDGVPMRTMRTWNNATVLVCDSAICATRNRLPSKMSIHKADTPRLDPAHIDSFLDTIDSCEGWMGFDHIVYVYLLTQRQHKQGIYGPVGEIGVHHGKFWMPITGFADKSEPTIAIDLFNDQTSNFDGSGLGSKDAFLANAQRALGLGEQDIHIIAADSSALTANDFSRLQFSKFRFFSVDGGHSLETTLHDLTLASCVLADGGIMVVDDFINPAWLGVPTAVFNWVSEQYHLAPFMWSNNKIYFTTVSHHFAYLELVKAWSPSILTCAGSSGAHESRISIGPHKVCVNQSPPMEFRAMKKAFLAAMTHDVQKSQMA